MFDFESFLSKYNFLFDSCKYTYYRTKCIQIVKKIFFHNVISEDDKNLLFKHTSFHFDEWKKIHHSNATLSVIGTLSENIFRGKRSIQVTMDDCYFCPKPKLSVVTRVFHPKRIVEF